MNGIGRKTAVLGLILLSFSLGPKSLGLAADFPLAFENYGRLVVIDKLPQKVVTCGAAAAEIMAALGLGNLVVGRVHTVHGRGLLAEYEKLLAQVPEIADSLAQLAGEGTEGTDIIIGQFQASDGELTWKWPPVYVLDARDLEGLYQQIRHIGRIFMVQAEAENLLTGLSEGLNRTAGRLKVFEPVKVLIFDPRPDGWYAAGTGDYMSRLLDLAGGVNVMNGQPDWSAVTAGDISARDPEVILIPDYGLTRAELKRAVLKEDPVLSQLEAVENDRILIMPLETLEPGVRAALAVDTMARFFHPSLFDSKN
ncbi:MAG: ABC transporter substrate-binding protein [Deltaproteobacteria bacterium]|jgi:iron complex transport system substrate-binding protein|nr:ABC transporter substrate-binding protein [Deltaproteobacteria bacterium]